MVRIEVEKVHSPLEIEQWAFVFDDSKCRLVLDSYRHATRATKRHGFKADRFYSRFRRRDYPCLSIEDTPLPLEIMEQAKQQLFDKITVVKQW